MDLDLGKLMEQAQQLSQQLQGQQEALARREVEGEAGAGMVKAVMSGRGELLRVRIEPKVFATADARLVEDLIVSAVNAALQEVGALQQREMASLTSPFGGLPGAFPLPGGVSPAPK